MANTQPRTGNGSSQARPAEVSATPYSMRPRSLVGQAATLLFQPGKFFRTLPSLQETRQWFWIALLVLGLVAFSTVRTQTTSQETTSGGTTPADMTTPPGLDLSGSSGGGGGGGGVIISGGGKGLYDAGPGGTSSDGSTPAASGKSPEKVSADWQKAAIAASNILLVWLILAIMLCEVPPLSSGAWPRFRQNLHIAIWASTPLAMMAALQLVYHWAGGQIGKPGLSGLLPEWSKYQHLSRGQQTLLLSFATRFTLFEWWTVILVYIGARQALRGKRWVVMQVVAAWIALIIVLPVLSGSIKAPAAPPASSDIIPGQEISPGGAIPGGIDVTPGGEKIPPDTGGSSESVPVPAPPAGRKG